MKKEKYTAYNKQVINGKLSGSKYATDYSDPGESLSAFKARVLKSNARWSKKMGTPGKKSLKLVEIKDKTKKKTPIKKVSRRQPMFGSGFF